jgi:hypothetical protein
MKSLDNLFPLNRAGWMLFSTHAHVNSDDVLKQFGKWDRDIIKFLKQRNKDVLTLKYKKTKPPYKWQNSFKIIKILYNLILKDKSENFATDVKKNLKK